MTYFGRAGQGPKMDPVYDWSNFSNRKDGVPYKDARKLNDFNNFYPYLLKEIPRYY
jgi:hypothetical protein